METLSPQVLELMETRHDFVVLLDPDGFIVYSNQNWIDYCCKHQLPDTLWKIGGDYLKNLQHDSVKLQEVNDFLSKRISKLTQLTSVHASSVAIKISIEYRPFLLEDGKYGAILYKQSLDPLPAESGGAAAHSQNANNFHSSGLENAFTDYLTGLPTRRRFEEKIEELLREEVSFSLIYINLDNFKHVNALYSHDKGDETIRSITSQLKGFLKPNEMAGRLDGDEFILLHILDEGEEIDLFPKKVREFFAHPVILENFQSITINVSIGVSSHPQESASAEDMIAFAETAMREAKKQIGSSYSLFHSGMGTDLVRRLLIEKGLAGNLKELGFHFAIQPQLDCSNGELNGCEILARWQHPELGPVSPVEFIGIAEETGTITDLTYHLINEVFTFINAHKYDFIKRPKTAINITPSLLTSKKFFQDLFHLMEKYQIQPEWLEIEITESVELTVSEATLQNLIACRTRGISIALDDFGTGFSMLAYLMDFPIDKIKLDKSFITKIGCDEKSEAVLKSLIQFVKSIGCELVAEGVETEHESAFLKNNGCLIHQGYFYDKPLRPEQFVKQYLLKKNAKIG